MPSWASAQLSPVRIGAVGLEAGIMRTRAMVDYEEQVVPALVNASKREETRRSLLGGVPAAVAAAVKKDEGESEEEDVMVGWIDSPDESMQSTERQDLTTDTAIPDLGSMENLISESPSVESTAGPVPRRVRYTRVNRDERVVPALVNASKQRSPAETRTFAETLGIHLKEKEVAAPKTRMQARDARTKVNQEAMRAKAKAWREVCEARAGKVKKTGEQDVNAIDWTLLDVPPTENSLSNPSAIDARLPNTGHLSLEGILNAEFPDRLCLSRERTKMLVTLREEIQEHALQMFEGKTLTEPELARLEYETRGYRDDGIRPRRYVDVTGGKSGDDPITDAEGIHNTRPDNLTQSTKAEEHGGPVDATPDAVLPDLGLKENLVSDSPPTELQRGNSNSLDFSSIDAILAAEFPDRLYMGRRRRLEFFARRAELEELEQEKMHVDERAGKAGDEQSDLEAEADDAELADDVARWLEDSDIDGEEEPDSTEESRYTSWEAKVRDADIVANKENHRLPANLLEDFEAQSKLVLSSLKETLQQAQEATLAERSKNADLVRAQHQGRAEAVQSISDMADDIRSYVTDMDAQADEREKRLTEMLETVSWKGYRPDVKTDCHEIGTCTC